MTTRDDYQVADEALRAGLASCTPGEAALLAQECLQRGELDYALAICQALEPLGASRELDLCKAVALFRLGRGDAALTLLDALGAQSPTDPVVAHYTARVAMRLGRGSQAAACLERIVQTFPDFPGAHGQLASLHFPGLAYREVLALVQRALNPSAYLEIGVETGATLSLAEGCSVAVGVDPVDRLQVALRPNTRVYFEESDRFFERSRQAVFGEYRVDLTFIDGMHWFEYALRDFLHAESWSSPQGTIILHDCLPLTPASASRERKTKFWVGDTWKALAALREYRPELRIEAVLAQPSGLVIVSNLDPASRVLSEALPEIVARYAAREYEHAVACWPNDLAVVPSTEPAIRALLERQREGSR